MCVMYVWRGGVGEGVLEDWRDVWDSVTSLWVVATGWGWKVGRLDGWFGTMGRFDMCEVELMELMVGDGVDGVYGEASAWGRRLLALRCERTSDAGATVHGGRQRLQQRLRGRRRRRERRRTSAESGGGTHRGCI